VDYNLNLMCFSVVTRLWFSDWKYYRGTKCQSIMSEFKKTVLMKLGLSLRAGSPLSHTCERQRVSWPAKRSGGVESGE